jgi:hypothetical protein
MSCTCLETNWMDGKGHDLGCPLASGRHCPLDTEGGEELREIELLEMAIKRGVHKACSSAVSGGRMMATEVSILNWIESELAALRGGKVP